MPHRKALRFSGGRIGRTLLPVLLMPFAWTLVACGGGSSGGASPPSPETQLAVLVADVGTANLLPDVGALPSRDAGMELLGKELFFSKSLSGKFDVACVSCHHPLLAGGDKLSLPIGESAYDPELLGPGRWHDWANSADPRADGGPNVARHSPTTFNIVLYDRALFFDGRVFVDESGIAPHGMGQAHRSPDSTLSQPDPDAGNDLSETQARFPVTSPEEMRSFDYVVNGSNDDVRNALVARLRGDTAELVSNDWLSWFRDALNAPAGTAAELITYENIQAALSAYQRSQLFINNAWFAYLQGDATALNAAAVRGALLFFRTPDEGGAGCANCHSGKNLSDEKFHNIAMPQLGRGKQPDGADFGRRGVTQREEDRFAFRTPGLLNVAQTAPYGHAGAFATLDAVIRHHIDPEASIDGFDFTLADNPQLQYVATLYPDAETLTRAALARLQQDQQAGVSKLPVGVNLSQQDIDDLEAFLQALSDPCVSNAGCLASWIPDALTASPDGQRLDATFAAHAAPPTLPSGGGGGGGGNPNAPPQGALTPVVDTSCTNGLAQANAGGFTFTEVAQTAGITHQHALSITQFDFITLESLLYSGGLAAGDLNGDCWNDFYFATGDTTPDALYLNQGNGTFSEVGSSWGISGLETSNGAVIADIDGDGDRDVLVSNIKAKTKSIVGAIVDTLETAHAPAIYRNVNNNGLLLWTDSGITSTSNGWSFALGDYDGDSDLDVLSTHWRNGQPITVNHLWKNTGTAYAEDELSAGLTGLKVNNDWTFTGNFSDWNADGHPDVLMASDFETSQVFASDGDGTFTNVTASHTITDDNGMGAAIVDYDNDGDLDWFVTSIWDPNQVAEGNWGLIGNRLYRNDAGTFNDVTSTAGVDEGYWGWGACFADFNNDGWQDIFHTNGYGQFDAALVTRLKSLLSPDLGYIVDGAKALVSEYEADPSRLFISNGDGTFTERSAAWGVNDTQNGRGVVCNDYDRDGDVDIVVANNRAAPLVYRNNARSEANTHFINIRLQGLGANTDAIGARVYVKTGSLTQLQEVHAGGGFVSGSPAELHFGLGAATSIDEIRVVWPHPHYLQHTLTNVAADQFILIEQPNE